MTSQALPTQDYDAIVIGAGFGGLRALYELKKQGKSVLLFDAGSDVGGTWYWNRYPGARTDSEAWAYCYSFSKELQDDWDWAERMPTWNQVQAYLSHVADRFDMRKDIEFNTRVQSCIYDEDANQWVITTADGKTVRSHYFISAVGWFAVAVQPPFDMSHFNGEWYMSSKWPKQNVDFRGKRVGIVGSGSTAVQLIPVIAKEASQLTVFQRTPNYVLPGRNYPLDSVDRGAIKADYENIWQQVRNQPFAFPMRTSTLTYDSVDDEERERIFEYGWEQGGFRFIFETFADMLTDKRTNEAAANFVRRKIRSIVRDPKTAEALVPKYPIALKRPPLGNFFYETFNRDNVQLVDVSEDPLVEATESGLKTATSEFEFDIIIFAIGFDAVTGPLTSMEVRGRNGQLVRDKWAAGPRTHLGIVMDGYPNMFVITGPQSPFSNVPPVVDATVNWIGKAIAKADATQADVIEAKAEAVDAWVQLMQDLLDQTLLGQAVELKSWFMGANIPGKAHAPLHYFGGASGYFDEIDKSINNEFRDDVDFTRSCQLV
ncbi:NAD(P)/FAD-dependent oxidoreductase [Sphingobium phenoxybenzoativorans]|uniref:NAD(P)/FAD-dependent oxidoreductase n=1 Tax=Sphingobium phenoxybenzoativorans TaxID=1592790 RepID=A0A975K8Q0_9SPHN|nr:NAD(P)/FAD-dependent oxidoreductase [Sphingobium phenoxybenzoativorans]QUT06871.1 NAD(P)/FAD-dependent oxidoreductase [Sphingobium phenoxybenzoativorans]